MTQKLVSHLENTTIVIEGMVVITISRTPTDCIEEETRTGELRADGLVVTVEDLVREIVLATRNIAIRAAEETDRQTQTLMSMPP
jgi:hypothetical protein